MDYKKKLYDLLRSKKKAFVCEERDWAVEGDDSDEKEFINLALMASPDEQEASSSSSQVLTTNISDLSKDECKFTIDDMSNELYNLHITLKSLTKEKTRIKSTNDLLLERNVMLETELLSLEKCKKECQISKDELILSLKKGKNLVKR